MSRLFLLGVLVSVSLLLAGCKTPRVDVPSFDMKVYSQDKKRVDQDFNGNAGYLYGEPDLADIPETKETRRMYYFQFDQEEKKEPEPVVIEKVKTEYVIQEKAEPRVRKKTIKKVRKERKPIKIPNFDEIEVDRQDVVQQQVGTGEFFDYTIQKNDTLQKISKKFYNSYSKWNRIYEANTDVLSSPDAIVPGTTIRVPK